MYGRCSSAVASSIWSRSEWKETPLSSSRAKLCTFGYDTVSLRRLLKISLDYPGFVRLPHFLPHTSSHAAEQESVKRDYGWFIVDRSGHVTHCLYRTTDVHMNTPDIPSCIVLVITIFVASIISRERLFKLELSAGKIVQLIDRLID